MNLYLQIETPFGWYILNQRRFNKASQPEAIKAFGELLALKHSWEVCRVLDSPRLRIVSSSLTSRLASVQDRIRKDGDPAIQ